MLIADFDLMSILFYLIATLALADNHNRLDPQKSEYLVTIYGSIVTNPEAVLLRSADPVRFPLLRFAPPQAQFHSP